MCSCRPSGCAWREATAYALCCGVAHWPTADPWHRAIAGRGALLLILHAIPWVFAMFVADAIWGDRVAQWMAVVFAVLNGFLGFRLAAPSFRAQVSE